MSENKNRPIAGRQYENLDTGNRVQVIRVDLVRQMVVIQPVKDGSKKKSITMEKFVEFYRIAG